MNIATQNRDERRVILAVAIGWIVVFLVCVFAYWPGLAGPFMLDDHGSIGTLGDRGGIRNWETFKAFVFGGNAGPTGRPLALLSFLIDGNNWPTDPWPFKRTNLVIHLVNGALLGVLTAAILRLLQFDRKNARWLALASTAFWLLHPFLVSTTLYSVQRMAQLSTLFIFAGIAGYLYGRSHLATHATRAYLIMSGSIGLFTFLAMISKENGILLPLLILVVESTVIASQQPRLGRLNRYWAGVFIVLPSAVVVLYLVSKVFSGTFFEVVPPRDYSLFERFLTQQRILADYLRHWFIPELYTTGVFQDHFIKSTGLFSPISTALGALLHIALISAAIVKRHKWPLFALAVLFFYAGHVLESSVLNLELYFEHRNYLSAAFLILPLVVLLRKKASGKQFILVTAGVVLLLGGFTRYSATVWKSFPDIIVASAHKAPTSARAQAQYATLLFNAGRYDESLQVIEQAVDNIASDHPLLLINRLVIRCEMGILSADDFERVADLMSKSFYDPRSIKLYTALTSSVIRDKCPEVSLDALGNMYENMLLVPQNGDPTSLSYSQINYFIGYVNVYAGQPAQAVASFEASLRTRPGSSHAMLMAAHLATGGYYEEALHLSDLALTQLDVEKQGIMGRARVTESDIHEFRRIVRADIEAARKEPGETSPAN
ncbi:MAG: hypothetical protein OEM50_00630 [Gammaproteobacteria bacterium]|nr:hypothetical protein [Gammaproteobacteria bacterium]MDH3480189.1 hypothetical protein [Gammaproteobacteria bacterium]